MGDSFNVKGSNILETSHKIFFLIRYFISYYFISLIRYLQPKSDLNLIRHHKIALLLFGRCMFPIKKITKNRAGTRKIAKKQDMLSHSKITKCEK